jgi:hypothetical protein
LLEELHPVDIEKEVEAAVASLGIEEGAEGGAFDAEEMAARREEAELAADEDSEEQVVGDEGVGGGVGRMWGGGARVSPA